MNEQTQANTTTGSSRRGLLYAGVGAAAALTGAGTAWWKWAPSKVTSEEVASLWPMSFDSPSGSPLVMQSLQGKPLLLNFWATWCPPCVEEMPLLDSFFKQNAANGWQVVGLAIDQPSKVREFLRKTPVSFPIGLAGLGGTDLAKALGNASGGLPFSVVLTSAGAVLQRRIGRVTADDLAAWSRAR